MEKRTRKKKYYRQDELIKRRDAWKQARFEQGMRGDKFWGFCKDLRAPDGFSLIQ